ncbi:hypothetical protein Pla86_17030 [Planctomycetes bacterium Pla86]|uniref:Uncharacterized protein n=1 Tax=Engelhardtia mirabilis TaxID=2528011 RepID=A0A518BI19_9BACT|nr:hypothetical protein Pla133_17040 [Planctomycetes bacterium Pla133]QDV00954.1 hypothetical protein Pla86_17030 [Planctomycetes bacterium Pla86]
MGGGRRLHGAENLGAENHGAENFCAEDLSAENFCAEYFSAEDLCSEDSGANGRLSFTDFRRPHLAGRRNSSWRGLTGRHRIP